MKLFNAVIFTLVFQSWCTRWPFLFYFLPWFLLHQVCNIVCIFFSFHAVGTPEEACQLSKASHGQSMTAPQKIPVGKPVVSAWSLPAGVENSAVPIGTPVREATYSIDLKWLKAIKFGLIEALPWVAFLHNLKFLLYSNVCIFSDPVLQLVGALHVLIPHLSIFMVALLALGQCDCFFPQLPL